MDDLASSLGTPDPEYGQDDIFSQVMGPDKPGRVRTFGLGPTPTQVFGSSYGKSQAERREIDTRVNEQIERIKVAMEASMEARMAKLREEMEAKFQEDLQATLQAMGCPVPQRDTLSSPLGTTQVKIISFKILCFLFVFVVLYSCVEHVVLNIQIPDASSSHRMSSPPLQSNPQLIKPQNLQSKGQKERDRQHELCKSSSINPKEVIFFQFKSRNNSLILG